MGSSETSSVEFCMEDKGWPGYTAVKKILPKGSTPLGGCSNVADDRQTDLR